MQTEPAQQPHSQPRAEPKRYRSLLFGACLVISVAIHILTVLSLFLANHTSKPAAVVRFIEIRDIAASRTASNPEIRMPAPAPDRPVSPPREQPGEPRQDVADKQAATPTASSVPDILDTPLGRGMANGFFSTLGDGRTLREDTREYYFELLERINDRWWQKALTLKDSARRDGIAEILIGRDGTLYEVKLTTDTGSWEVDRAIVDVLSGASPLPALPASYELEFFRAPVKFTAPLQLLRSMKLR